MNLMIVGAFGFLGSISRYIIYLFESRYEHTFPYGTLVINTLGCLIAGVLIGLAAKASPQNRQLIMLGSIGFVGSFTTFSTFSVETLNLLRTSQMVTAFANVCVSLILGLMAVWLGMKIMD